MPRSFRLPPDVDGLLGATAARTGQTASAVVVQALRQYVDRTSLEADLLDDLDHDFTAASLQLGRDEHGNATVAIVDAQRRTTSPTGAPHATTEPLERLVDVQAVPAEPGRTTIELVGAAGGRHAGVRVWLATLPLDESTPPAGTGTRAGPTISLSFSELHPQSRATHKEEPNK